MKTFWSVVGIIVAILVLMWIIQGNDFFLYKTFAPKYEQVRRQTFEQTKSYKQGMIQDLQSMQFEIAKTADSAGKNAMAAIMLHRVADFPLDSLPADLHLFIDSLKAARLRAR